MLAAHAATFVTEEEFLQLPPSMDKVELIDGEVIMAPAATVGHQSVLGQLSYHLVRWSHTQPGPVFIGLSPLDVRFGQSRILQPDAFVYFGPIAPDHRGPLDIVPAVCIEVVSSDRVYDRITKRMIYAAAGVPEYWTILPAERVIERWTGAGLGELEVISEVLETPRLPGLALRPADLGLTRRP